VRPAEEQHVVHDGHVRFGLEPLDVVLPGRHRRERVRVRVHLLRLAVARHQRDGGVRVCVVRRAPEEEERRGHRGDVPRGARAPTGGAHRRHSVPARLISRMYFTKSRLRIFAVEGVRGLGGTLGVLVVLSLCSLSFVSLSFALETRVSHGKLRQERVCVVVVDISSLDVTLTKSEG
jgi:hypothetical protein